MLVLRRTGAGLGSMDDGKGLRQIIVVAFRNRKRRWKMNEMALDDERKARRELHKNAWSRNTVSSTTSDRSPSSNLQRLISRPLSSVPQQEMRQDGRMAQSEMLAQLRRNGGSGFDGQDRRLACKDGVGRGAGRWLEMAYRRREVWDTAL